MMNTGEQDSPVMSSPPPHSTAVHSIDHDVRTLQQALRVVLGGYGGAPGGDAKERLRATEWLRSFRSRDDAWDACVAVLGAPRGVEQNQVSFEEQVFASQALLYKCRRRRAQITGEDVGCLLRLASAFTGSGLRPVLTQLCLGLCACAVRHPSWESSKVLPDVVVYCQQASERAGPNDPGPGLLMLEILTVLPDEASSKSGLTAHPDRRTDFLRALRGPTEGHGGEGGRLALGVLSQLLEPGALPQEGARTAILRCALSWVQLEAVDWETLFASPVMAFALESLEIDEACDEACELATITLESFTQPGAVHQMLPRVLSKAPALANPRSEDVCRCVATVFGVAACSYLPYILVDEFSGHWASLLRVMVAMLEHVSLEIAGLALEFWGSLGELLTETAMGDQGPRSPQLEESMRHACLVAIMRARYPGTEEGGSGSMDVDARDELEDFRDQVQELLQTLILPTTDASENPRGRRLSAGATLAKGTFCPSDSHGRNGNTVSSAPKTTVSPSKNGTNGTGSSSSRGLPFGVALSPVQRDLLSWLENLAATATFEAIRHEGSGHLDGAAVSGHGGAASALSSLSRFNHGSNNKAEAFQSGRQQAGRGDWTQVEVLLRMLSTVAKAFEIRDGSCPGGVSSSGISNGSVENGRVGEASAIEAVVDALPALPSCKRELQRSMSVLVGGLAPWLARRPRSLEPALKAVLGALGLEEDGSSDSEPSMRDKGEEHVGAVALSKLVTATGPSLASVPHLPTHLLERYLDLSVKLQHHRLLSATARPPPAMLLSLGRSTASMEVAVVGAWGGGGDPDSLRAAHRSWPRSIRDESNQNGHAGGGGGLELVGTPPLHASSLRLFLGSLCRMLDESHEQDTAGAGNDLGNGAPVVGGGIGGEGGGAGEREEVLRRLIESEARCLGGALDRRRQLALSLSGPTDAQHVVDENRAVGELVRHSLSNTALILRKSGSSLDAPGLVARYCGLGPDGAGMSAGGGGGGLLVDVVAAYGDGEEKVLAGICHTFEALVWSIAERLRQSEVANTAINSFDGFRSHDSNGGPISVGHLSNGYHVNGHIGGRPEYDSAQELRLTVALGDALAEVFMRRPFVRFLDTLRCVTRELATFGRHSVEQAEHVPNLSLRACEWVQQCLWSAANGAAAAAAKNAESAAAGGTVLVVGGSGWGAGRTGGGPDAHPELVEALFKLMTEWINELPVPSLRWLEHWLTLAVSGMVVRHRGPARAVLHLVQACCAQKREPAFTAEFSALLQDAGLGVAITRGLLSGLCGTMPCWMLDDLVATIRALFNALNPALVSAWVEAVLRDPTFERYSVTDEVKVKFARKLKEDLCCKDWRAFKAGLKAFCGGKKKGTGGTPPVHASAVKNRQQQQQQQQQQRQQQQQFTGGYHSGDFAMDGGVGIGGDGADVSPTMARSMTL